VSSLRRPAREQAHLLEQGLREIERKLAAGLAAELAAVRSAAADLLVPICS
jgi:hypothetical protein